MPNTYFRFRQFSVHQERTAMKVCTDACLFGAWVANELRNEKIDRILDVGAGTGLLSLMLAQVSSAMIDAVEIDDDAFDQAKENFNTSPWKERLSVFHTAIQEFAPAFKYDLIISNPPFYQHDLKSDDNRRNIALHGTTLTFDELLICFRRLLKPGGKAAVLIPFNRSEKFEKQIAGTGYSPHKKMNVRQSVNHDFFRSMYILSDSNALPDEKEIAVGNDEFNYLLKGYYL
jgi:tRNA1Val (adenine37-N6)-methyltransferase